MGGKAIKKVTVIRLEKTRYEALKNQMREIFLDLVQIDFPIEVPGKKDFGDLDILYQTKPNLNLREKIIEKLNPVEIVTNGNVISIGYKLETCEYFQIDFIKCTNMSMDKFYYSYGDLGGIIGRISKYYGLTFGNEGLYLYLYSQTVDEYVNKSNIDIKKDIDTTFNFGKIFLSDNPKDICEYLGFDYNIWENGFYINNDVVEINDKEKIFEWVKNSKLFSEDIFRTLNYQHRRRFNLRPFYQNFVEYIFKKDNQIQESFQSSEIFEIIKNTNYDENEIKHNYQLASIEYFGKIPELELLIRNHNLNKERNGKFNGHILIDLGVEQKTIGMVIKNFKTYIVNEYSVDFNIWLDSMKGEEVLEIIKKFVK